MDLETIANIISRMEKTNHIEILQIISKYPSIPLNPKSDGFRFRLDLFPREAIDEIEKYIEYVQQQETALNVIETQKEEIKRDFFDKPNA